MKSWLAIAAVALALGATRPAAADPPVAARIYFRELEPERVFLKVERGSNQGIRKNMHAYLVDGHGKAVPGGALRILRVELRTTTLSSTLTTIDDGPPGLRVQFDP